MAFPLSKTDYERVGKEKGLTFVDEVAPNTVYEKCNWVCDTCGKPYFKTYRAVYLGEHGCRCQNSMSMPIEKYVEAGKKFGLEIVKKANNYKEPSLWRNSSTGAEAEMSYYELTLAPLKSVSKFQQLGVNIAPQRGKTNLSRRKGSRFTVTPESTPEQKERALQHAKKISEEVKHVQQQFRLPNQEDEEEFIEVYD